MSIREMKSRIIEFIEETDDEQLLKSMLQLMKESDTAAYQEGEQMLAAAGEANTAYKRMGRGVEIVEYSEAAGDYVFTEAQLKSIQDASDAYERGEFLTEEEAEKDLDEWMEKEEEWLSLEK